MPPPMKSMITSEHEGILWNSKHLSTDTSIGLIQAVTFYLIKCFGLWQGKDLKLLKTEHVTFGEDEMGYFVAIDLKKALGAGKVIKRYDDPGNPRSAYKILKTYKGYLANEGPFLVRPISSIKDYICYSPWPLGLNIIEQTVVNLMQECGIGSGFGNVSVCLMAIDILKSFGAGSHCISTWMLRLYPRYKKTFWAETFKECSTLNCEEKSDEACLVISHLLDPPYPATTLLAEMRRKQEMMQNKSEAISAWRTSVFNSWLSNINSTDEDLDVGNKRQPSNAKVLKKGTNGSPKNAAGFNRTEKIKKNVRISSEDKMPIDSSLSSSLQSSSSSSSNITVKTEIMTDTDCVENQNTSTDVKIMTVLSIPESAFSAQVDEGECMTNKSDTVDYPSPADYMSKSSSCHVLSPSKNKNVGFKRKLKQRQNVDSASSSKAKQAKIYNNRDCSVALSCASIDGTCAKGSLKIGQAHGEVLGEADKLNDGAHNMNGKTDVEVDSVVESFGTKVKCEQENECDNSSEMMGDDSGMHTEDNDKSGKDQTYNETVKEEGDLNNSDQTPNDVTNVKNDLYQNSLTDPDMRYETQTDIQPIQSYKIQDEQVKDASLSSVLDKGDLVRHSEGTLVTRNEGTLVTYSEGTLVAESDDSKFANVKSKVKNISSSSLGTAANRIACKTKDSIEILRKLLQRKEKSVKINSVADDLGSNCEHLAATIGQDSAACVSDIGGSVSLSDSYINPISDKVSGMFTSQEESHISSDKGETRIVKQSCKINCCMGVSPSVPTTETKDTQSNREEITTKIQQNCNNDFQPAADIVKFLNAAKIQLQNILQVSSLCSLEDCEEPQIAATSTMSKSTNNNKVNVSISSPLLNKNCRQELLTKDISASPAKTNTSDLVSPLVSVHDSLSTEVNTTQTKSDKPEPQNTGAADKEEFFPLLRSVLERPGSPPSLVSSLSTKTTCLRHRFARRRKRFPPPLSGQTHEKLNKEKFHGRNSPRHKHLRRTGPGCKLGHLNHIKTYNSAIKPSAHRQPLTDPSSSSLLKHENLGPNSGIYYYRSNHKENAAYQSLQITRQNQRTQTFTMSDLPLDVPESKGHSNHLGFTTSEICLGDYFPEGTLVPMKDMKLLTKQGCNGLEVVLKFDYKLPDVTQTSHMSDSNKKMETPDCLKDYSAKNDINIMDS